MRKLSEPSRPSGKVPDDGPPGRWRFTQFSSPRLAAASARQRYSGRHSVFWLASGPRKCARSTPRTPPRASTPRAVAALAMACGVNKFAWRSGHGRDARTPGPLDLWKASELPDRSPPLGSGDARRSSQATLSRVRRSLSLPTMRDRRRESFAAAELWLVMAEATDALTTARLGVTV